MTDTAVAAKVKVELVALFIEAELVHALLQLAEVLFTLAAANDLTDAGNEAVHGCNGLAIVVQLHIESLDLLGIVCDEDRALEFLLGEVALMLGLQIAAPGHLVIKLVVVLLKDLDSLVKLDGTLISKLMNGEILVECISVNTEEQSIENQVVEKVGTNFKVKKLINADEKLVSTADKFVAKLGEKYTVTRKKS